MHHDTAARLANLKTSKRSIPLHAHMPRKISHTYLRPHRKKSGLTQRELANILGSVSEKQVSRHELGDNIPAGLHVALGYEVLFGIPVSEIFPGIRTSVARVIEIRLDYMEQALKEKSAKGRDANAIARKLEWINERRKPIEV